ncbi:MAG: glycosyltransferase [Cyclobacteriaceae bacterium]
MSIIMPMRNAAIWVADCIDSIIQQFHHDWELIVVDDFSTDGSMQVVLDIGRIDSRIKLYQNEKIGIIGALQLALNHATGTYVTRMDADDLMPADKLSLMVKELDREESGTIVTGLVQYFSQDEISKGYRKYEDWINEVNLNQLQYQNIYRECVIASPNWMMHRNELVDLGAFSGLSYPEDYDLVFKWYAAGFKFKTIPKITHLWREHPSRTSKVSSDYNQRSFFDLKIHRFLQIHDKNDELVIWGNNTKSKLTTAILDQHSRNYIQLSINNYEEIANFSSPQLLIAVYPPAAQRKQIEAYLTEIDLLEGSDWWYL